MQMTKSQKEIVFGRQRLFLFTAADKIFGLNVADIREVIHMAERITPPGRPSFLSGFINIEGNALPVVDLALLLGFAGQLIEMYTPLVILKSKKFPAALIVGKVIGFETIESRWIYPLDDGPIFNQCVSNSGKNASGDTFYLLAPEKIMLAQERQVTIEFQVMVQKRINNLKTKDPVHV
jgi:purine-binding chemotaxis protein CheW